MLQSHFRLLFTIFTCLGLTSNYCLAVVPQSSPQKNLLLAQTSTQLQDIKEKKITIVDELNYDSLMQTGYVAKQNQDYLTAWKSFSQALSLRPNDQPAQQALSDVSGYAFDIFMQAGYAADRNRNYQTALDYFQTAQSIRPDSFHAQQAVNNIKSYLATADVQSTQLTSQANEETPSFEPNILLFVGLIATAALAVGIVLNLFKTSANKNTNKTKTEAEHSTIPPAASSANNSVDSATSASASTKTVNGNGIKYSGAESVVASDSLEKVEFTQEQSVHSSLLVSPKASVSKLDIVPELIKDLHQGDRTLRRQTIWELAQRADSRAMKPLVELMVEVDSQEKGLILEAITQIVSSTLKPMNKALMLSLKDDNAQVRQNAIRDFTRVYELMSQVTQRLSQAAEDSDVEVKETAQWALNQLNQIPQVSRKQ